MGTKALVWSRESLPQPLANTHARNHALLLWTFPTVPSHQRLLFPGNCRFHFTFSTTNNSPASVDCCAWYRGSTVEFLKPARVDVSLNEVLDETEVGCNQIYVDDTSELIGYKAEDICDITHDVEW